MFSCVGTVLRDTLSVRLTLVQVTGLLTKLSTYDRKAVLFLLVVVSKRADFYTRRTATKASDISKLTAFGVRWRWNIADVTMVQP